MASPQQTSNTPESVRDSWETPPWLFNWANERFSFDCDLAASKENAKTNRFFDIDDDALSQDWYRAGNSLWCNCPYSEPAKWVEKAWEEAQQGARIVMLIPTFNGDQYWKNIESKASLVINIVGRVSFITSVPFTKKGKNGKPDKHYKAGDEVPGNSKGSCFVVFDRTFEGHTDTLYVNRDDMREEYEKSLKLNEGTE